jgi:hypothetical protein
MTVPPGEGPRHLRERYDLSTVGATWDAFIMPQADSKQPEYT